MRRSLIFFLTAFLVPLCAPVALSAMERSSDAVDFNRDIRPILSNHCYACHGRDEDHRQAGLRLDDREAALGELDSGARAIVAGDAQASELYARVTSDDEYMRMPPVDEGDPLSKDQVDLLRRWIDQGAEYARHWSFTLPSRPVPPNVVDEIRIRRPLDRFVQARLETAGLRLSPAADRYTLIRRLSLDLRGLPPSPAEVEAFVADPRPDAYERLVDRLLADPAYGERWARMWLDLARYADSAGYGSDPLRTIWRYRDWVIDAMNHNMPYDQFTIEQLAGDLLPSPTLEQQIATAMHRNTMTNTEGGTDDEEFRTAAVKDRVDSTLQIWMGLTAGCAKCHTHKFDPISQREYYELFAFFNQTADNDQPSEVPVIAAPTMLDAAQHARIDRQVAALRKQIDEAAAQLADEQARWEQSLQIASDWKALDPANFEAEHGAELKKLDDLSLLAAGENPPQQTYRVTANVPQEFGEITALRIEALRDDSLPASGPGRAADGRFVLSRVSLTVGEQGVDPAGKSGRYVRIELPGRQKMLSLAEVQVFSRGNNIAPAGKASQSSTDFSGDAQRAIDGNTDGHYFNANSTTHTAVSDDPWWEVDLGASQAVDRIVVFNRTDGDLESRLAGYRIVLLDEQRNPLWQNAPQDVPDPSSDFSLSGNQHIALAQAAADSARDGFPPSAAIDAAGDAAKGGWSPGSINGESTAAFFLLAAPLKTTAETQLTLMLQHQFAQPQHALGRFRISVTDDKRLTNRLTVPADVLAIVDAPPAERTPEQAARLAEHYRTIAPSLQSLRRQIAGLEKSRPQPPTVPVLKRLDDDKLRTTRMMIKGDFLNQGEAVEPGVLSAFHPFPVDAPRNRRGLATWLVDPNNPLTARVAVNRYWAQLFGAGLVETEEDFGAQGEAPSHPELLDWLAVAFLESGWDAKALLRTIVTSHTYRQSSRVTPQLLEKDPHNRLLSRGPRHRLEAEMVRDQALALAGLLSKKMRGPSVYPPQPPGLWRAAFNGKDRTWPTDQGEDRYRRGLYTFWRRTIPYPSMATFDAPSREICNVRRIRTNTPLQALVTLNDPVYVEAAQGLARRIVREGGDGAEQRAAYALQLCLVRAPQPEQLEQLIALYQSELRHYQSNSEQARELAAAPPGAPPVNVQDAELAAWTIVANVLLNMDGVLSKN